MTLTHYRDYQPVANFVATFVRAFALSVGPSPELARKLLENNSRSLRSAVSGLLSQSVSRASRLIDCRSGISLFVIRERESKEARDAGREEKSMHRRQWQLVIFFLVSRIVSVKDN